MKKLILMSAIVLGGLSYKTADAQIGIHVNLGFGTPVVATTPVVNDYDDDYYYLPDVDAYYSVPEQCYYYYNGDSWETAAYLPGYRDFDWRSARRYEIRAAHPYMRNDFYRERFGGQARVWAEGRGREHFDNGGWGRGHDFHQSYENRGWNERGQGQFENRGWVGQDRGHGQFDNRGFGQPRGDEQYNNGNRGGWQQQGHDQWGGQQGGQQNQNYNQGQRGEGHNWGGQPANQNGGNRGGFGGGQEHFTQNRMFGGRFGR
jgi:hypothetical protein